MNEALLLPFVRGNHWLCAVMLIDLMSVTLMMRRSVLRRRPTNLQQHEGDESFFMVSSQVVHCRAYVCGWRLLNAWIASHRTLLQISLMDLLCLAWTSCQAHVGVLNNSHDAKRHMGLTLHLHRTSLVMRQRWFFCWRIAAVSDSGSLLSLGEHREQC